METSELLTADQAAAMFGITVNAFRIYVHRYGKNIKRVKLGRRKTYFLRSNLLEHLSNN
jgi:hypothetical protein